MRQLEINEASSGQRLDKYVLKYMNKAPKSLFYKLLRKKMIKLNRAKAEGNEILSPGDQIQLFLSDETLDSFIEEKKVNAEAGKLRVIYEDENILVADKEPGVLSQPEKPEDRDTMPDRLIAYLQNVSSMPVDKTFSPAFCNRLDRNTSGLMVAGKNLRALQALSQAFRDREIDKYYTAMVKGKLKEAAVLTGYLLKDHKSNQVVVSQNEQPGSKEIITEYTVLETFKNYSLLEIKLVTGRSHQIRAHLKSIGHPIIGDRKYGDLNLNFELKRGGVTNQLLHCSRIVFNPSAEELAYLRGRKFSAPLPDKFKNFIESI